MVTKNDKCQPAGGAKRKVMGLLHTMNICTKFDNGSRNFIKKHNFQPHGGIRRKVREISKSEGFILW